MKKSEKINNSLTFISDSKESVSTVCFGLYFNVGSTNENENNCGITHLIEHLFFRKLNNIGNRELYHKMESLGGTIRGYTTRRYVCFELQVLKDFVRPAFALMNEFLSAFEWTDNEVNTEKQIILNEMVQVGNDLDYLSADQTGNSIFVLSIKGTPDSLKSITTAQVNDWKSNFFNCSNCCFIVTGNVDDGVLSEIKLSLESHERASIVPKIDVLPDNAFNRSKSDHLFSDGDDNYADVFIFFDLDLQSIDWTETLIAFDIFCNGDGSKLSFAMKDELGWVYEIDSEITHYGMYGSIKISWSIANDHLIESLNLFFDLLKVFKSKITAEEFESLICMYESYKSLGGNSFVHNLVAKVKALPIDFTE